MVITYLLTLKLDERSTNAMGFLEDVLGKGSAQATSNQDDLYKDKPFWDALTAIQNLRVVVSGHGTSRIILCPGCLDDSFSLIYYKTTETNGVRGKRRKMWSSASISTLGMSTPSRHPIAMFDFMLQVRWV